MLPTKTELKKELEKDLEVIKKHYPTARICNTEKHLWIDIPNLESELFEFESDIPKEGSLVVCIYRTLNNNVNIKIEYSTGLTHNGKLKTYPCSIKKYDSLTDEWYCISTKEHSKGWKMEWLPEEFR